MRAVIEPDALAEVFRQSNINSLMQLADCKLGVTQQLMNEYHNKLAQNLNYISWFNATQANNKLELMPIPLINKYQPTISTTISSYVVTSYCHSHYLIINSSFAASNSEQNEINAYGISAIKLNNLQTEKNSKNFGVKPFLTHHLRRNTNFDLSIISNYFHKEESIFFYDKYITNDALNWIAELCRLVNDNATIRIMTTDLGRGCKTVAEIQATLNAIKPHANIIVCLANIPTRQEMHDRYIFLGDRIQITLTRGLDAFGPAGNIPNTNKTCDISLFWIGASNRVGFVDSLNNTIRVSMIA